MTIMSRSSDTYEWSTSNLLGKGSFGHVYLGIHKQTGEDVAVKTFKGKMYPHAQYEEREFELMETLSHDNIVKVIAIEHEAVTGRKVMIMELCRGGNLEMILKNSENIFGLKEEDFLCVLKDITDGLKYLRNNDVVHRDIKPSNIMKFISDNGSVIYKLADFGAARYLKKEEEFSSIFGTEEYLHPKPYQRKFFRCGAEKFGANVDLWSIGVTIYQIATGFLPFQPYGGRNNKKAMHLMTAKKPAGVISGIQSEENKPVKWSKVLPETCMLKQELKNLVVVLLAGILEVEKDRSWTFDQYFDGVTDIVTRKVFHIFYLNEGKEITLFMQPHKKFKDLEEEIEKWTKLSPENQLILFDEDVFIRDIDPSRNVSTFPCTSCNQPYILMQKEKQDDNHLMKFEGFQAAFTNLPFEVAERKSEILYGDVYLLRHLILKLVRCQDIMLKFPKILVSIIAKDVQKLWSDADTLKLKINYLSYKSELLNKVVMFILGSISESQNIDDSSVKIVYDRIKEEMLEKIKSKDKIKKRYRELILPLNKLKQRVISESLTNEWGLKSFSESNSIAECAEVAKTYYERINEGIRKSITVNTSKGITHFQQPQPLLQNKKMENYSNKLILLKKDCLDSCFETMEKIDEWFSGIQTVIVQSKCFQEDLFSLKNELKTFFKSLEQSESDFVKVAKQINASFPKSLPNFNQMDTLAKLEICQWKQEDLQKLIEENKSLSGRFLQIIQDVIH